jgi:hypothetical protein
MIFYENLNITWLYWLKNNLANSSVIQPNLYNFLHMDFYWFLWFIRVKWVDILIK